jgi:hypothetical protein
MDSYQETLIDKQKSVKTLLEEIKKLYQSKTTKDGLSYIKLSQQISDLYNQIREINASISNPILVKPIKSVKQKTSNVKQKNKTTKKIIEQEKVTFTKGDYCKFMHRNIIKFGIILKVNKKKCIIESGDSEYIIPHDKIQIIEQDIYDKNINLKDNILVGESIHWTDKGGNVLQGTIKKLNKVKAIIIDEKKDEYAIDYKKLFL